MCQYIALTNQHVKQHNWHLHWHGEHQSNILGNVPLADNEEPMTREAAHLRADATREVGPNMVSHHAADAADGDPLRSDGSKDHSTPSVAANAAVGLYSAVPRDDVADAARPRVADAALLEPQGRSQGRSEMSPLAPQSSTAAAVGADASCIARSLHSSHVIFRTESFLFCARCGAYSRKTIRSSSALLSECQGAPPTLHKLRVRDQLMRGIEPTRPVTHTGREAIPN